MSEKLQNYIELTRIKKPIGYMLLFWPCVWGVVLAYDFSSKLNNLIYFFLLFLTGSILMRSAGCTVNDIVDRKFDSQVARTKNRPIASGKISPMEGIFLTSILCFLALIVLVQFNKLTIFLALGSMPLAFMYPYMKRFTYWPQLFLGITFNYGIVLGWTSITNSLNLLPFLLYLGAIFWTLGYDTIYGYQDIKDDEIIGVKSTSIKFKQNPKFFISMCYAFTSLSLITVGIIMEFKLIYFFFLILVIMHLFFMQIRKLEIDSEKSCLKIFRSNNLLGFIILINIFLGKVSLLS